MYDSIVTVFGGSGFIGRYVVEKLAQKGWIIRVAVRRPANALFLKSAGMLGQITPIAANIRDRASVEAAVAGSDAVINLVGILYQAGAQRFAAIQAEGAGLVARAAREAGARQVVHISAIGADPASPAAYARSKAAGEEAMRTEFSAATILRPSIVYGAEDAFFNRFAAMAQISPFLPLIGGGRTLFQPVYVVDVADAVVAALERPEAAGQTYELGGPHIYSFRELMEFMLLEIRRKRLLLPIPFPIASLQGLLLQGLPRPPLTLDQVRLLRRDNIVAAGAKSLPDLGVAPTALELILPTYLDRYRPQGSYNRK